MNVFKKATIEISSVCNAKCTWCTTGLKNLSGCKSKPEFMSAASFEKGLIYMTENGIIDRTTEIELYNWGEPFLNPEINDICGIIIKHGFHYHLSTNASVFRKISPEYLKNIGYFRVSLSGFSKETYAVTHALDFSKVMDNIIKFRDMLAEAGKQSIMDISFLVYKFNCHEIGEARRYFEDHGIGFTPRLAYYADFGQFQDFLNGTMDEDVKKISREHIFEDLLRKRALEAPENFDCPQNDYIVLSHKWEIVPCCRLTDLNSIGNLFDMDMPKIKRAKENIPQCRECIYLNQHYIVHSPTNFRYTIDPLPKKSFAKFYLDTGSGFNEKETIKVSIGKGEHKRIVIDIREYLSILRVRFDPCDEPCFIKNIIFYVDGKPVSIAGSNGDIRGGGYFLPFYSQRPLVYPLITGGNPQYHNGRVRYCSLFRRNDGKNFRWVKPKYMHFCLCECTQ